jgi:hypothetical protein
MEYSNLVNTDNPGLLEFLLFQKKWKKTAAGLDFRLSQQEFREKISDDLNKLSLEEEEFIDRRTALKVQHIEKRVLEIEEKQTEKLIDLNHKFERHSILLAQTQSITVIKGDLEEISYNINNDDRINNLATEWDEKLNSMFESLERIGKSLEKISTDALIEQTEDLHREIAEDNIKKEQESVRIEVIRDQIQQIWKRCDHYLPFNYEIDMEQELFLQGLEYKQ